MRTDQMIAILRGQEAAPETLMKVNLGVRNTAEADRVRLVEAIEACIAAHEAAGRVVAGGLFLPYSGSFSYGIVGVHIFAVGRVPDDALRHSYVGAELPGIEVSEATPSQGYPRDTYMSFGIMLDVSHALVSHVGNGTQPVAQAGDEPGDGESKRKKRRKVATDR